jgi:single-strand DNA-binding protein
MAWLNRVYLLGNLTRDPELRYTTGGKAVTDVGLAVNNKRNDSTLFIDCTVWDKSAEAVSNYLKKGSLVMVEGELQLDRWEKEGEKRSKIRVIAHNIQFLDKRSKSEKPQSEQRQPAPQAGGDDIPF